MCHAAKGLSISDIVSEGRRGLAKCDITWPKNKLKEKKRRHIFLRTKFFENVGQKHDVIQGIQYPNFQHNVIHGRPLPS